MTEKIRTLRERLLREGREIDIEVDGGINEQTARIVLEAGANVLVMGSAVFDGKDVAGNVRKYLKMMEE